MEDVESDINDINEAFIILPLLTSASCQGHVSPGRDTTAVKSRLPLVIQQSHTENVIELLVLVFICYRKGPLSTSSTSPDED